MATPAQREVRARFAEERRRIREADRKLHTAPSRSTALVVGMWSCAGCKELRWGGERVHRAEPGMVRFYDPACAP
jgi:hypothetical protein